MEVEAERGESIMALAKVEILLHCDQPRKALGLGIVQKGGWEEQRNVDDVIVRGGRNEAKFWLVHLLNLTKLRELTTEGCMLFDDICWKIVQAILHNELVEFLSLGVLALRTNEHKKNVLAMFKIQPK